MKEGSRLRLQAVGLIALVVGIIAVSVFLFSTENRGNRRVLYFESMDGTGQYMESRRIMEYSSRQGRDVHVRQFVQELLLGPATHGLRPLFQLGTSLESCFLQDKALFINLSQEALFPGETTSSTRDAVDLLILNVRKNFSWIESVEIYICSNKVYENVV